MLFLILTPVNQLFIEVLEKSWAEFSNLLPEQARKINSWQRESVRFPTDNFPLEQSSRLSSRSEISSNTRWMIWNKPLSFCSCFSLESSQDAVRRSSRRDHTSLSALLWIALITSLPCIVSWDAVELPTNAKQQRWVTMSACCSPTPPVWVVASRRSVCMLKSSRSLSWKVSPWYLLVRVVYVTRCSRF